MIINDYGIHSVDEVITTRLLLFSIAASLRCSIANPLDRIRRVSSLTQGTHRTQRTQ